eukprot:CAMPEP_0113231396 /NCGR_PEP_ID=MMETSP0008_2-20120614/1398_1 /TAXON_ID=97485 /ORGANISM="Prymnesium parvum" /LENGTH=58 /DNA_ID=CAMNT_0000078049 /DNA_START=381 /DNA_END=557 /DNA_ORIENTATION=+ /assembly_acc=CAM_ASM_000153
MSSSSGLMGSSTTHRADTPRESKAPAVAATSRQQPCNVQFNKSSLLATWMRNLPSSRA